MNNDVMFATEDQLAELNPTTEEEVVESEKYLIFFTDDLKFGVCAEYVEEIITNHSITFLPMVPDYIRGIINLRGQIVPIIDIRLRLGKPSRDDFLIIVLDIDGIQMGILVDAVDQMVDVPKASILPMPAHNAQHLVSGMCSLPDNLGTMMILDCGQLSAHE